MNHDYNKLKKINETRKKISDLLYEVKQKRTELRYEQKISFENDYYKIIIDFNTGRVYEDSGPNEGNIAMAMIRYDSMLKLDPKNLPDHKTFCVNNINIEVFFKIRCRNDITLAKLHQEIIAILVPVLV